MTKFPEPAAGTNGAPAALSAFLRGVERRAAVLGQCQCGGEAAGEHALAAAMRAFRNHAAGLPMAEWPQRFWSLLVATAQIGRPSAGAAWPADLQALVELAPGDRLALLLRIAAGLDETAAAQAMGVSQNDYRQALARACPRTPDGQPDAGRWRALAETVQARIRDLDPVQAARLAGLREGVAEARPAAVGTPPPPTPEVSRRRTRASGGRTWRRSRVVAAAVLALLLAALATWSLRYRAHPLPVATAPGAAPQVLVEELPADGSAAAAPAPAVVDGADRAMLADPDFAIARDADFHAWIAAGHPLPPDESEPPPATVAPLPDAALETVDVE